MDGGCRSDEPALCRQESPGELPDQSTHRVARLEGEVGCRGSGGFQAVKCKQLKNWPQVRFV